MFLMLSLAYDTNYMLNILINFSLKDWITTCIIIMIRATIYFWPILCQVASLSRKSRNTWSKRQIWPWNTEWSRAKTNRVLPRERTGHSKHPLPVTQKDSTHGHHQMVNTEIRLIIFFAAKDGEALYSQQKQDQELTVAQIMSYFLPNSEINWRK